MSALCILAGGATVARLAGVAAFSLVWSHSVEKTEWREDWRITPGGLVMVEASVEGSGAGMDPPDGARLSEGRWRWTPSLQPLSSIVLRRSGATRDWSLCVGGSCSPLARWVAPDADPVELAACREALNSGASE